MTHVRATNEPRELHSAMANAKMAERARGNERGAQGVERMRGVLKGERARQQSSRNGGTNSSLGPWDPGISYIADQDIECGTSTVHVE